ncbi:DNA-binding protein inhibitor ID-2-A-like [Saccostrea cucullata]|uniref:DNA-binding protein inhibitor ID-2-A-like n=1 Tax=Saccostrea cuccullata TaxID=36930 RepID=UPI002ED013C4
MKAITQPCVRPVELGMKKDSMKVMKKVDDCAAEMQACFSKLKELVPSVPQDKRLSKTQLLQHVIDYILDLETALDFNPAVLTEPLPNVNRAPLSEKPEPNTIQAFTQMAVSMDQDESCDSK